jgi:hypothetical protein
MCLFSFPCRGVPKGWVYGRRLIFVSVRTNKRQHHQRPPHISAAAKTRQRIRTNLEPAPTPLAPPPPASAAVVQSKAKVRSPLRNRNFTQVAKLGDRDDSHPKSQFFQSVLLSRPRRFVLLRVAPEIAIIVVSIPITLQMLVNFELFQFCTALNFNFESVKSVKAVITQ